MIVKEMCKKAGIEGTKSNHSLRATGATELYRAGVPEKIGQDTGHWNLYESMNILQSNNIKL